ncbi:hypothetical protein FKM82_017898 [Ascaphus truei]
MESLVMSCVHMTTNAAEGNVIGAEHCPNDPSAREQSTLEIKACETRGMAEISTEGGCDLPQTIEMVDESLETSIGPTVDDMISLSNGAEGKPDLQGLVVIEHQCGTEEMRASECLELDEPKMCNEMTATYWTGGAAESQKEDKLSPSTHLQDRKLAAAMTVPYYLTEKNPPHNNVRLYFPLHKTLRNLRLLDLKLKYHTHQVILGNNSSECTNDSGSSSDESASELSEQKEKGNATQEESDQATNSSLINLLSQCQLKLEQLEELKHYSRQLASSLWEAQETIAYLQGKVGDLQLENAQKEEEIAILSEVLTESKRLSHEKVGSSWGTNVMLRNLGDHLENQRKQRRFQSIVQISGNSAERSQVPRDSSNSKMCVIL